MPTIAAFDIGVKNLALCVAEFDSSGTLLNILRWNNLNLLAGGADSQSQTRCVCGGPASWTDISGTLFCKRCAKKPGVRPTFPVTDLSGNSVNAWRTWGIKHGLASVKSMTKKALMAKAAESFLMPYVPPKSGGKSLQTILAGMETCLDAELPFLAKADHVLMENQPCSFAPTMKSIQIMLFTLVSHRLKHADKNIPVVFVHAGRKTAGDAIAAGKEHKRARKIAGIARVETLLAGLGSETWTAWFHAQAKRDDVADAMLMCADAAVA